MYLLQLPNPLCTGRCLRAPLVWGSPQAWRGIFLLLVSGKFCLPVSPGKAFLLIQKTGPHLHRSWSPPARGGASEPRTGGSEMLSSHRLDSSAPLQQDFPDDRNLVHYFLSSQQKAPLVNLDAVTTLSLVRCLWPLLGLVFSLKNSCVTLLSLSTETESSWEWIPADQSLSCRNVTESPQNRLWVQDWVSFGSGCNLLCDCRCGLSLPLSSPSLSESEGTGPLTRLFFKF